MCYDYTEQSAKIILAAVAHYWQCLLHILMHAIDAQRDRYAYYLWIDTLILG